MITNQSITQINNTTLDNDFNFNSHDVITIDQIPSHPNLTYTLNPIYNNRYFGTNIFNLTVTKIQGSALDIIIPLGQFLISNTTGFQNMTVAKPQFINLSIGIDVQSINLTVYCVNVDGEVPQRTHAYLISPNNATGDLAKILIYIHNNTLYDLHYTQLTVWAATDGPDQIPSGYIYNNTEVAWANALLLAAGTSLIIPDMPSIPGFPIWEILIGITSLFIIYRIVKRGRKIE